VRAELRAMIHGETRHWPLARRAELMEHNLELWAEAMALGEIVVARL
jgi:hypothetical protein